jgi:hypothetical protein
MYQSPRLDSTTICIPSLSIFTCFSNPSLLILRETRFFSRDILEVDTGEWANQEKSSF